MRFSSATSFAPLAPFAIVALLGGSSTGVAQSHSLAQPKYTAVYSSDSLDLLSPALSPDGQWVAFTARPALGDETRLMIIRSSGGTPVALTSPGQNVARAVWFPSSDRIIYQTSALKGGLMSLAINRTTGTAVGAPRRVTLEPALGYAFAISPDGKQIAYGAKSATGAMHIKVMPANGGNSRVVADVGPGIMPQLHWLHDNTLEFAVAHPPNRVLTKMKMAATGGSITTVATYDQARDGFALLGPYYTLRGARIRIAGDTLGMVSLVSASGDTLGRFDTRGASNVGGLNQKFRPSDNAATIMMAGNQSRDLIHALSTSGGAPWVVRPIVSAPDNVQDWPDGSTLDSRSVYVHSGRGDTLYVAPVRGGEPRKIMLPPNAWGVNPTPDNKYLFVRDGHPRDTVHTLSVVDLASGRNEKISSAAMEIGSSRPNDTLFFGEERGNQIEIRRWLPGKGTAAVQRIPRGTTTDDWWVQRAAVRADGSAYTYAIETRDSVRVFAGAVGSEPRLVLATSGRIRGLNWSPNGMFLSMRTRAAGSGADSIGAAYVAVADAHGTPTGPAREIARGGNLLTPMWSPDSRTLFTADEMHGATANEKTVTAVFFDVNEAGQVTRTRRTELPNGTADWDDAVWSKDNQHVFLLTSDKAGYRMHVWKLAGQPGERLVNLAAGETASFYDLTLSPDEKTLVYQAQLPPRSTIWRVDFPALSQLSDGKR
jgi:Tol biopolymer transport system component